MLNLWQNKRKGDCPFFLILWFYGCNSMINALIYLILLETMNKAFKYWRNKKGTADETVA